jgi:uncharacterized protein (DUF1684 family)
MRPFLSGRWLLVIIGLMVVGVLWWPKRGNSVGVEPMECASESLYVATLEQDRRLKDSLFRVSPHSPIPREKRAVFGGLGYYPIHLEWCLRGRYEAMPNALLPVVGRLYVALPVLDSCRGPAVLTVYGDAHGKNPYVAFWDSTAAVGETYEGGRYVPLLVRGDSAIIDFNRAYFPYCAYNPDYICLPYPPSNRFCGYIRAGERYGASAAHP